MDEFSRVLPCILNVMWGGVKNLHGDQDLQMSKSLMREGVARLLVWLSDRLHICLTCMET